MKIISIYISDRGHYNRCIGNVRRRMDEVFKGLLRSLGLKVTPRRLAVLEVMAEEGTILSAEQVWTKARARVGNVGLPTIYRILEELEHAGRVTRVVQEDRQSYYYFCSNEHHHHHFVCVSCKKVEDLDLCLSEGLRREISERIKGTLFSHIIQLQGLCRRCTKDGGGR